MQSKRCHLRVQRGCHDVARARWRDGASCFGHGEAALRPPPVPVWGQPRRSTPPHPPSPPSSPHAHHTSVSDRASWPCPPPLCYLAWLLGHFLDTSHASGASPIWIASLSTALFIHPMRTPIPSHHQLSPFLLIPVETDRSTTSLLRFHPSFFRRTPKQQVYPNHPASCQPLPMSSPLLWQNNWIA